MGYDYTDVKDFIDDRGLPDNDMAILVAGMREPHRYKNALFRGGQNNLNYQYMNPQQQHPQQQQQMMMGGMMNQQQQMMYNNQYASAP